MQTNKNVHITYVHLLSTVIVNAKTCCWHFYDESAYKYIFFVNKIQVCGGCIFYMPVYVYIYFYFELVSPQKTVFDYNFLDTGLYELWLYASRLFLPLFTYFKSLLLLLVFVEYCSLSHKYINISISLLRHSLFIAIKYIYVYFLFIEHTHTHMPS